MPYLTHTLTTVDVDRQHPKGICVTRTQHATLEGAMNQQGTTGAIFCDELTIGYTVIREENGRWVNDWANPDRVLA